MTSLDDLLDQGAREPIRRRLPHLRWLVRTVVASAVLGGALVAVLLVLDLRIAYPVAAAGFFTALTLHRLVVGLRVPRRRPREADELEQQPGAGAGDGLGPAVVRWQARLNRRRSLRPGLAELVDERLRQRHGLGLTDDPDRARTLLGEKLFTYLVDPAARTPSPRELAAMLTSLEEL
ncbi:MAG TPA: hypothetical protein VIL37_12540 [Natronosporangium sp.]